MLDTNSSLTNIEYINHVLDAKIIGVPVWQTLFLVCSVTVIILLILMCCCFSFRIPRTKQEIEADYIRKLITRKFRKELNSIPDSEMDEMDLSKAIERVRFEFLSDEEKKTELMKQSIEKPEDSPSRVTPDKPNKPVEDYDRTSIRSNVGTGTSDEKLMERCNSVLSNKFVTIVNAFTVLRPRKISVESKSKQITV